MGKIQAKTAKSAKLENRKLVGLSIAGYALRVCNQLRARAGRLALSQRAPSHLLLERPPLFCDIFELLAPRFPFAGSAASMSPKPRTPTFFGSTILLSSPSFDICFFRRLFFVDFISESFFLTAEMRRDLASSLFFFWR